MRAVLLVLLFVSVFAAQDDRARELVEKLGSDDPTVREASERDLIKLGEKALTDVKKAEASTDAEVRVRAKRVRETIELELRLKKNDLTWLKEAAPKELAPAMQDGGVELKAAEGFEKAEGQYWTVFRFLDRACFEKAGAFKGTTADSKFDIWSIVAHETHLFCHLPSDGGFPRYYAVQLPSKIEISEASAKWDSDKHVIPCLSKVKLFGEGWRSLDLERQQKIGGGVLYSFGWAQDKPYPSLRYLHVTEKLALLCIDYQ